jgi:hypothetical protein
VSFYRLRKNPLNCNVKNKISFCEGLKFLNLTP